MKFSIIVPVHNAEHTIYRCIKSLIEQPVEKEIIIIEDHSTDSTVETCKVLATNYDNIIFLTCDEYGTSSARNMGLRNANGDVICFCDADDEYEENALCHIEKSFENSNLDIVVGGIRKCLYNDDSIEIVKDETFRKKKEISGYELFQKVFMSERIMGSVCNKFYKKDIVDGYYFNSKLSYCEDTHFNAIVLANNKNAKCLILNLPIYKYICNSTSVTNSIDDLFTADNCLKYIESMRCIINDCILDKKQKNIVFGKIGCFAFGALKNARTVIARKKILKKEIRSNFAPFLKYYILLKPKAFFKDCAKHFFLYR